MFTSKLYGLCKNKSCCRIKAKAQRNLQPDSKVNLWLNDTLYVWQGGWLMGIYSVQPPPGENVGTGIWRQIYNLIAI